MATVHDDPYAVLGVSRTATDKEIRSAFRKLAKECHPDLKPGDAAAEDRFKKINRAYDIIGDAEKRGQYDRGEIGPDGAPRSPFQGASGFGTRGFSGTGGFGGARGFSQEDLGSIFSDLFGGGGRRGAGFGDDPFQRGQRGGQDVRYRMDVSFEDAAVGARKRLTLHDGSTIDVTIPAGIESGQTLRLKGKGQPGHPPGDALIEVHIAPHARFTREGNDIHLDLPITLPEAVLGGKVTVPTLSGSVVVTVPANASSGRTLRLKGKGIHARGHSGDMYVHLSIVLPETQDAELEDFLRGWRDRRPYAPAGR